MNEELQFGYPAEKRKDIEDLLIVQSAKWKKGTLMLFIALFSFLFFFTMTLYYQSGTVHTIFMILSLISLLVFIIQYKFKTSANRIAHFLCINAFETYIDLDYFSTYNTAYHTHAHLLYSDIQGVHFGKSYNSTKMDYGKIHFTYYNKSGLTFVKRYDQQGKEYPPVKDCFISFELNKNTPEQGFFFYTAHKLFKVDYNRKKIVKKYGDEDCFYSED